MKGLPLALDRAGAYIEETRCSFANFLHLFETAPVHLLQKRSQPPDHPLLTTVLASLTELYHRQGRYQEAVLLHQCMSI